MTEKQQTVTDRTQVDAPPAPPTASSEPRLTRREIRLAEQRARESAAPASPARAPSPVADLAGSAPVPNTPSPAPAPVSRRALRDQAAPQPTTPGGQAAPVPTTPGDQAAAQPAPPGSHVTPVPAPVQSRRDVRHAPTACSEPFALIVPQPRVAPGQKVGKALTVVALSGSLLVSGFGLQAPGPVQAGGVHEAAVSPGAVLQAHVARTTGAEVIRLTAQGSAYASQRRTAALQAAQATLAHTETVVQTAGPVLAPEDLAPLAQAAERLEALLHENGGAPLSTGAGAPAATTAPLPEALSARAETSSRASRAGQGVRSDVPADGDSTGPSADAAAGSTGGTSSDEAQPTPGEGAADRTADGTSRGAVGDEAQEPDATGPGATPGKAAADAGDAQPATTDLAAAVEMSRLSQDIAQMSSQVQAAVDLKVAEEQARALAEAAEAAAAADAARKVQVAKDSVNGKIPLDVLCSPSFAPQALLRCDAAAALERLNEAYRAEFGADLRVVSSYRSYSMQVATRRSRGWLAAAPGTSNHGRAVAVDFDAFGRLGNFSSPSYIWMKRHAAQYGWNHPAFMERGGGGPQEPWHWEFGTE